jgi:hypothetical protein
MKLKKLSFIGHGFFWLFMTVMVFSCNNSKSGKKTDKDTTIVADTNNSAMKDQTTKDYGIDSAAAALTDINGPMDIPSYTLTAAEQQRLFAAANSRHLKFKMDRQNVGGTQQWVLVVFSTRGGDLERHMEKVELQPSANTYHFDAGYTLSKQRVNRGHMKDFYGDRGTIGHDVPISVPFQDIVFTPIADPRNAGKVCFRVNFATKLITTAYKTNAEGDILTNPSPPARPCEALCDQ